MKTFVCGGMMVSLSFVFMLLGTRRIVAGGNGSVVVDSSRKTNLRRGLGFDQQQRHLVDDRLTSTTSLGDRVEEELENIENDFDSENQVPKSETEELENIEKEFNNANQELKSEAEEVENTEREFDSENQELKSETEVRENIDKEVEPVTEELRTETEELEVSETETEDLEEIEKEFDGEKEKSISENKEVPENETTGGTPVEAPTVKPMTKQIPLDAVDEILAEEEEVQELETALKQEEKVARQAGGLGIFLGIVAMIFTAHQMSDNPDGIYASICRLAITISSVGIKIMCMPCRKLIGGASDPYSGHMPISTSDYSFRSDPYRSNANAGFEMR